MHYEQVQVIYKGYQTVLFNLITDFFRPFLLFPLSTPFFELEHHGNFVVFMKNIIQGHFFKVVKVLDLHLGMMASR